MPTDQTIDFVIIFLIVGLTILGFGSVVLGVAVRAWDRLMSRAGAEDADQNSNEDRAFSPATTTPATSNNALQSNATYSNGLLDGQARALAAMVQAGKVGETDGIKIVFGVSPSSTNARYQAARAALKAELERLTNHYPNMTPEQKQAREALGIGKP